MSLLQHLRKFSNNKRLIWGEGPTTKKTKDIVPFSQRHDLFCSFLFFVILLEDIVCKPNPAKITKKIKQDKEKNNNKKRYKGHHGVFPVA